MPEKKIVEIDIVSEINILSDRILKNSKESKPYKYCLAGLKLACKELLKEKEDGEN